MNYAEHMRALLRPLGLYELNRGLSAAEIEAEGAAFDDVGAVTETLENECTVTAASNYGLEMYEAILPRKPVMRTAETRRAAICALLAIDDGSFTEQALNASLAGCGIPAHVEETGTKYTVSVCFPGTKGVPDDIDALKNRIEDILPCHLDVQYVFTYFTWGELESTFASWNELETEGLTWREIEGYGSL